MRLAIVPARGGSRRIPRKNVRDFCGKPMIAWSIEAALQSGCFERVVVSTDDAQIAELARAHGADTPFVRPPELSDDHTATLPVIAHAADALGVADTDLVCCIYATAAFVRPEDLQRGLALLESSDAEYAFSVTSFAFPIQRAIRVLESGRVEMFDPGQFNTRSQDLEHAYHDAGQFYWGRARAWRSQLPIFGPRSAAVLLPRHRVQDIDTPEDWTRAEWMFRALSEHSPRAP